MVVADPSELKKELKDIVITHKLNIRRGKSFAVKRIPAEKLAPPVYDIESSGGESDELLIYWYKVTFYDLFKNEIIWSLY